MERDILGSVIEIEEEIKSRLEAERKKAEEWLGKIKKDTEEEAGRQEDSLQEAFQAALETERENAGKRASEILDHAKARAERLENLHDEILRGIISKYIIRILPGESDDSPDVES